MDNQSIPAAFSLVQGLGARRGYYPAGKMTRWGNLVICLVLLAGSASAFLYGAYTAYQAYQLHGPAVIGDKLTGPLVIAGILFLLGLLAGWGAYRNWGKGVAVYEKGFAYHDRKGLQLWNWEGILSLTSAVTRHYSNGIYTGTTHVYTLLNRQEQKLKLADSIGKVADLAKSIEANIFPLLYPRAIDQYNSGQPLVFGPVAISKQGITIGKKTFPWAEVKAVSIHQGILRVSRKEGGWFSGARAAASAVPNLRVLLAIVDQVVGVKAG